MPTFYVRRGNLSIGEVGAYLSLIVGAVGVVAQVFQTRPKQATQPKQERTQKQPPEKNTETQETIYLSVGRNKF